LLIVSPDSLGTACPLSGRNSTYRPVQILEAGSLDRKWRVDEIQITDNMVAQAVEANNAFVDRLAQIAEGKLN